jgi:hypothetical protein
MLSQLRRVWSTRTLNGAFLIALTLGTLLSARAAQPQDRSSEKARTALMWRDPGALSERDLFWGSGAPDRVPQPPYRFKEEDTSGTQPKLLVTDARGDFWDVKFGVESRSEIAANRIVWAFGYLVEEAYFVAEGEIPGAPKLDRADEYVDANGRFTAARFKRRNPAMERTDDEWSFAQNPFVGTKDLSGLTIVMNLINNWDIEGPRNNAILRATRPDGSFEYWYIVSDLGGTFGRMGGRLSKHSKWNLSDFLVEPFIESIGDSRLDLHYDGMDPSLDDVPVEHARWFANLASGLSNAQLRRAFEAAGASPAEIEGFSGKMAAKISELSKAVATSAAEASSR